MDMAPTKTTAPKPFCFVLMPFDEAFEDIYKIGIREACEAAGGYCERVDEQIFQERILDRIYNQISKADIIIADMTGRNPNVFYEVDYAHALGKATILLTREASDIPFDLQHFQHIVYGNKISDLRENLSKKVRWFIENPLAKDNKGKNDIELFLGNEKLASEPTICICELELEGDQFNLPFRFGGRIIIHNVSNHIIQSGTFKIALLTSLRCLDSTTEMSTLPDGRNQYMLPDFPILFPKAYSQRAFYLTSWHGDGLYIGPEEEVTIRLFTEAGTRDFKVIFKIAN